MEVGSMVQWGDTYLTGRVTAIDGDYVLVEIVPDLRLDVGARFRKFFVPGMVVRIHCSSLSEVREARRAA